MATYILLGTFTNQGIVRSDPGSGSLVAAAIGR